MTDETTPTPPTTPTPLATPAPSEGERIEPSRAAAPQKKAPSTRKPRPKVVGVPNDPVADMLTRVRNAAGARHETVSMPTSRTKVEIAKILKSEGFISSFEQPSQRELVVKMKYIGGKVSAVSGIRRISKPGLRVYARKTEMPRVLGGLGIAIVSTSAGVMTGRQAERKGLGGEVLAYVW
jgi:small subunit ribosomal protein S8